MTPKQITTLFLDIGGVLLTNGWDHNIRTRASEKFNLNYEEMNERHHLTFDTYESGRLSLDEYLKRVVFYQSRDFTPDPFKSFMYLWTFPRYGPEQVVYIDDRAMFVEVAQELGIQGIIHTSYQATSKAPERFRLKTDECSR